MVQQYHNTNNSVMCSNTMTTNIFFLHLYVIFDTSDMRTLKDCMHLEYNIKRPPG